jgi:hypothetical protein
MFGDDDRYRAIPLKATRPEPEPLDWIDITLADSDGQIRLSFDDGAYVRRLNFAEAVGLLMYLHIAIGRMPVQRHD